MSMGETHRVMVIGLDSAPPSLAFERFLPVMPNLAELMDGAKYGPLRSCHPPITVPAWAVMATGKTPGELGMYGFRHRRPGSTGSSTSWPLESSGSRPCGTTLAGPGRSPC